MSLVEELVNSFMRGWHKADSPEFHDKRMHETLSEEQIDEMVKESFPASDPPSTY